MCLYMFFLSETEKVVILSSSKIFSSFTEKEIKMISSMTSSRKIPAKTIFIEEGSDSDVAYLISKGSARVFKITDDGEEINLSIAEPGELIGEMSMIEEIPRSASVQALQELLVLTISKANFMKVLNDHPKIAIRILQLFSKRIRKVDERLEEVMTQNLIQRVFKTLQILAKYFPNGEITLNQEELAPIIGATRPRITEALHALEKANKVDLAQRKITLI